MIDEDEYDAPAKTSSCSKKWQAGLHRYDIYAKPITLTYNNAGAFPTIPGALMTFLTIFIFLSLATALALNTFVVAANAVDVTVVDTAISIY